MSYGLLLHIWITCCELFNSWQESLVCTLLYMRVCICRKMSGYRFFLRTWVLSIFLPGTTASLDNDTHFTSTGKPLQCHEINAFYARSTIECSLHCKDFLYSCAGYTYERNKGRYQLQCEVCLIYDVGTAMVTANVTNSTATGMPKINKAAGEKNSESKMIFIKPYLAQDKWAFLCRRHIQIYCLLWKLLGCDPNFTELCIQYSS